LNETLEFVCDEASAGTRLDVFLTQEADLTRSAAQKLIESGDVTVSAISFRFYVNDALLSK